MTIVIDMDNVLCNLQEVIVNLFNKRYGTKYSIEDFTDYDVAQILPKNEAIIMKNMYGEDNLYSNIKPLKGAQNAVEKLVNAGHQVYIVSDVIPKSYSEKVEWLKFYFPQIDESHIIAMKHKSLLRCDVMIEDNLQNLLAKPYYERICFDYAWNRNVNDYVYGIHRVSSWSEVMGVINKLDLGVIGID
jgi:5'(3')-deoxyribonucleotidase